MPSGTSPAFARNVQHHKSTRVSISVKYSGCTRSVIVSNSPLKTARYARADKFDAPSVRVLVPNRGEETSARSMPYSSILGSNAPWTRRRQIGGPLSITSTAAASRGSNVLCVPASSKRRSTSANPNRRGEYATLDAAISNCAIDLFRASMSEANGAKAGSSDADTPSGTTSNAASKFKHSTAKNTRRSRMHWHFSYASESKILAFA